MAFSKLLKWLDAAVGATANKVALRGPSAECSFGALTVTSGSFSGNVTVGGTLEVSGNITADNALSVTNNITCGGSLSLTANATVGGTLGVTGSTSVGGDLAVSGTITGTLTNAAVAAAIAEDPASVREAGKIAPLQKNQQTARLRCCSTRSFFKDAVTSTLAVQTQTSIFHVKTTSDVSDLQVVYANPVSSNPVTIKVAVDIGGTIYKVFFAGERNKLIEAGAVVISDPVGFPVAKGTLVKIRTYADAGIGNVIKANNTNYDTSGGGSVDSVDYADSGTITLKSAHIFSPNFLIGICDDPCLLVIGDSISEGYNGWQGFLAGWIRDHFGGKTANGYHVGLNANILQFSKNGLATNAIRNGSFAQTRQLFRFADVALIELGVVNMGAAGMTEETQQLWDDLDAIGLRVWQTTITPRSTSTDGWATIENQTASNLSSTTTFNEWVRTTPTPLTGYIEVANTVSSDVNSGIWKAGWTTDGLHPTYSDEVAEAMAENIPDDLLTR